MQEASIQAFINGCIQTMDKNCSKAEAVLVSGGRIEAVGSTAEILEKGGKAVQVTDLKGRALYPGFIDTHSHISIYANYSDKVYCGAEVGTLDGALQRLAQRAKETPPGELVVGWGFDDTILPDKRGPSRQELDAVAPNNPVLLIHISTHVTYANSKALKALGYTSQTTMEGGEVVLGEDGEPNGILLEMAAFESLTLLPKASAEMMRRCLLEAVQNYNAEGFTATHEAGLGLGGVDAAAYMRLLQSLEGEGKLNLGMYISLQPLDYAPVEALGIMQGFGTPLIRFGGPKLFNDGSIQMYTAALLEPYHGRPDHKGSLLIPAEEMAEKLIAYHCAGYQITYHGNGDAGIECMIQAIEKAQKVCPRQDPRHILVHCQTASDSQLERMSKLGIIPTFFGLHVWYYGDRHRDIFLGPERASRINPSGTAVRLGMKHSLHADTPVLPPMTIRSIHTAVNRITYEGHLLGADQRISIEEAVRAYTSHAAYFQFDEQRRGTIEPGKRADFVVLSHDLLAMRPEDLLEAQILMTMVGGRVVYENNEI